MQPAHIASLVFIVLHLAYFWQLCRAACLPAPPTL